MQQEPSLYWEFATEFLVIQRKVGEKTEFFRLYAQPILKNLSDQQQTIFYMLSSPKMQKIQK